MIAVTGACIVLSRLPAERNGLSRALASGDLTNTMRAGSQLALVGQSAMSSTILTSSASGTGTSLQTLCVRAERKTCSSAA